MLTVTLTSTSIEAMSPAAGGWRGACWKEKAVWEGGTGVEEMGVGGNGDMRGPSSPGTGVAVSVGLIVISGAVCR